jgi:hypothetical protein
MNMRNVVRGKLCPECGGPILLGKEAFAFHGVDLGEFEVHVCGRCGESSFTPAGSRAIDRAAKAQGLFGARTEEVAPTAPHPRSPRAHA